MSNFEVNNRCQLLLAISKRMVRVRQMSVSKWHSEINLKFESKSASQLQLNFTLLLSKIRTERIAKFKFLLFPNSPVCVCQQMTECRSSKAHSVNPYDKSSSAHARVPVH